MSFQPEPVLAISLHYLSFTNRLEAKLHTCTRQTAKTRVQYKPLSLIFRPRSPKLSIN